jgi:hypothetical protein
MSRHILMLIAVLAVPLSLTAGPAVQAADAQGASTAVITPASGPPGSTIKASGANWTAGDDIQAEWGDDYSNLGSPVVVASDGTFTDSFAIPSDATPGSHQVLFWDQQAQYFVVANFDVTSGSSTPPPSACPAPSVSFTPTSGPVGTTFTITGSGWVPGGTVASTLPYGSPGWFTGYQTPTVNANGDFSFKETVGTGPGGPTPPGAYTFTYAEKNGDCSLSFHQAFTVTPKPSPTCPPTPQPRIYWSQIAGPQGTRLSLTGNGWYANDVVSIHLPHGFYVSKTSWPADSSGDWQLNIMVGDSIPPGSYGLTFSQSACGGLHVTGDFKVTMTYNQWVNAVNAINDLVQAGNDGCKIVHCPQAWSESLVGKAIEIIGKAQLVYYVGKIAYYDTIDVSDTIALLKAEHAANGNLNAPGVKKAYKQLQVAQKALETTLYDIFPPLLFIFPPVQVS